MKARLLNSGRVVDAFAIYVIDGKKMFLLLPENHGGLISFSDDELDIIDGSFNSRYVHYKNDSGWGVFHWSLIEKELLDNILENDKEAYDDFLKILKEERLVPEDFY